MHVYNYQIEDVTAKLELAERIAGQDTLPKECLMSVFAGTMKALEKKADTSFKPDLKLRVWTKVSAARLVVIKEYFLMRFCDVILGSFPADIVEVFLKMHKQNGTTMVFEEEFQRRHDAIRDEVMEKVKSLHDLRPEIVSALRAEGIKFPDNDTR